MPTQLLGPTLFLLITFLFCLRPVTFAQESDSFFEPKNFHLEDQLAELYQNKNLVAVKNYPVLRRLVAQKIAQDIKTQIRSKWADRKEPFTQWMEQHPDLLENYLVALDPKHDDIWASLRIMCRLCTDYPKEVEEFPELAIATAVVWDKSNEGVFNLCGEIHFGAKPFPDPMAEVKNFLYYMDPSLPVFYRIKDYPWEFLSHIVCHKTNIEDRRWALQNYGNNIEMLGMCYDDVHFVVDSRSQEERDGRYCDSLLGVPYTLINIKKNGTVCSGRGDFMTGVCRSLGVPAFRCAGVFKYSPGHYWVKWLEMQKSKPGKITFTLEQCGTDEGRQDRISLTPDPQTGQEHSVTHYLHTLVRAGDDLTAYRHAKLLMQCYRPLVKKLELSTNQKLELLLEINAVCPGNLEAWQEIVKLNQDKSFEKKYATQMTRLYPKMVDELLFSPDELPGLTKRMFQCPELKKQEKKCYKILFTKLGSVHRADLVFEGALNYSESLDAEKKYQDAFKVLAYVAVTHYNEANHINPVLDRLEKTVEKNTKLVNSLLVFYDEFLPLASQLGKWPAVFWTYNLDMLNRGLHCFQKYNDQERVQNTKQWIAKIEKGKENWEAGASQWIEEEATRQKSQ